MARTSILAPTLTGGVSAPSTVVAAGAAVQVGIYVAAGDIPYGYAATINRKTPGADQAMAVIKDQAQLILGPCEFTVTLTVAPRGETKSAGVFLET